MTQFRSDFLRLFQARGQLAQCTDPEGLDALLTREIVPAYIGFDCTAASLHVGSMLQIMTLRRLQQTGHKPIVVMGGGTTKIGDPSGRDETRQLLSDQQIEDNKKSIQQSFQRFIRFGDGPTDAIMIDNAEWLDALGYISFLREIGRHISVNRMLTMESVKLRLEREQPLSFLEFNYMIVQAYDFVELNRRYGCRLQCGGTDQWGNIVTGIDLGRRLGSAELFGLTSPLVTTASGAKMGKTAAGAVWLNPDMCSPYDYWQYWRNTEDADVGRFLRLFTEVPEEEIKRLEKLEGAELNEAKKILATEASALAHGIDAAQAAADTARRTFEEGVASVELPTKFIDCGPNEEWQNGRSNTAFIIAAGIAKSNSEAARKIKEGVSINGQRVSDPWKIVFWDTADPNSGGFLVEYGKKTKVWVKPK